jgi:hypothetical protein
LKKSISLLLLSICAFAACKKEPTNECPTVWETNVTGASGNEDVLKVFNGYLTIRNFQGNTFSDAQQGIGIESNDANLVPIAHSVIPYRSKWSLIINTVTVADAAGYVEINFHSSTANAGSIIFRNDSIVSVIPGYQNELPQNFHKAWVGSASNLTAELWLMPDFDLGFKLTSATDTLSGTMPYFNSGSINVGVYVHKPNNANSSYIVLDKANANEIGQTRFDDNFDCNTIANN